MPTVNGKKYPYTTAGKAAAKAGARALKKGAKNIGRAAATVAKKSAANKALSNAGLKRDNAGKLTLGKRSAKMKAATKGMLQPRTPAQIRKMQTGMANATKKRKAGKGQQK